jgi:hypothetical protein
MSNQDMEPSPPRDDDRNEEIEEPAAPDPTEQDQPADDDPEAD